MESKIVGVIGAGSFGTAIANLLAYNSEVLIFSRNPEVVNEINTHHLHKNIVLSPRIRATSDLQEVAVQCTLIFPIVPSSSFRRMMINFAPYLRPYHILIHGTKGLDLVGIDESKPRTMNISRKNMFTMSEVIKQESVVVRVGCLSGPNLASEIIAGQPAATAIGSEYKEVIKLGQKALNSKRFHVFGTHQLLGAELAGALKNVIAIGSGILEGKGMGKNIQAMLITRGLIEMINFGKALGATPEAFLGTAGIGDLIATATSTSSRNFTVGLRLAKGESIADISKSMEETAEGIRTLRITRALARHYKLHTPITEMLHEIVFEGFDVEKAMDYLMEYPYGVDVDFL
jgi:glycerol-3-phosphate dehydrogenase (NAD(P)+)